jgi:hypothetical protein
MDDRKKKAFDFASDLTKQLITLATAIIGGLIAFGDKGMIVKVSGALAWALGAYGLSAVAGGLTLMALTGQLGSPDLTELTCSAYAPSVRIFSGTQIVVFIIATGIFAYAAITIVTSR